MKTLFCVLIVILLNLFSLSHADMAEQKAYLSNLSTLEEFIATVPATEFFPEAEGYGEVQQNPHQVPGLKARGG